ncbi:hypothetical protein BUALT_Bualt07G0101300 [Buddleja alternifolia]|uniref:Uncharacterized protein n=1 Tax=Buddleja alternifolia TaxID=168488 RepID=A0AAV6X8X2_9LAMI|nr:hypothetical protein BUALT_Bualt07G0101300 [Buddleja alternifolia]
MGCHRREQIALRYIARLSYLSERLAHFLASMMPTQARSSNRPVSRCRAPAPSWHSKLELPTPMGCHRREQIANRHIARSSYPSEWLASFPHLDDAHTSP